MIDVLVVGSGPSAVHAALPCVKAGHHVVMVDPAEKNRYHASVPAKDWRTLRLTDPEQHRYFLGEEFEGVPLGKVRVGAQLTPPRQYIARLVTKLFGYGSEGFQAMQGLTLGGLAAGWGAMVPPFVDEDMRGMWPLRRDDLQEHYDAVAREIGVAGADDDLKSFLGEEHFLLPEAPNDSNATELFRRYRAARPQFQRSRFAMGQPRLAACTVSHRGRGPMKLFDMEFWADQDSSIYRPIYTVSHLEEYPSFHLHRGVVIDRFEQREGHVVVQGRNLVDGSGFTIEARRVILGAGAIGSARIALASLGGGEVPIVSNPYTYFPCLFWGRLGQSTRDRRHSLTQALAYMRTSGGRVVQAQVYSYRSLLTFKLMKESPLSVKESREVMRLLQPYYIIVGVHHGDAPTSRKRMRLDGDCPRIDYHRSAREESERRRDESELMRQFRRLACLPLARIDPGDGASIHYAGTLPMTREDRPLTTDIDGRLRGTTGVYVVDGSVLASLPAKGLTFTCMANARRVGMEIAGLV